LGWSGCCGRFCFGRCFRSDRLSNLRNLRDRNDCLYHIGDYRSLGDHLGLWNRFLYWWRACFFSLLYFFKLFFLLRSSGLSSNTSSPDYSYSTAVCSLLTNRSYIWRWSLWGDDSPFFADISDNLISFLFADGRESVAQLDAGFFTKVDQHLAVEAQVSGKGKDSNLQNITP
jgi:hypothetical protein